MVACHSAREILKRFSHRLVSRLLQLGNFVATRSLIKDLPKVILSAVICSFSNGFDSRTLLSPPKMDDQLNCHMRCGSKIERCYSIAWRLIFFSLTLPKLYRQTSFLIGVKKSRAERMTKKCQYVWPINVGHLSDVWFLIEKREKKDHIFVRDQWIISTLKSSCQTIQFRQR